MSHDLSLVLWSLVVGMVIGWRQPAFFQAYRAIRPTCASPYRAAGLAVLTAFGLRRLP